MSRFGTPFAKTMQSPTRMSFEGCSAFQAAMTPSWYSFEIHKPWSIFRTVMPKRSFSRMFKVIEKCLLPPQASNAGHCLETLRSISLQQRSLPSKVLEPSVAWDPFTETTQLPCVMRSSSLWAAFQAATRPPGWISVICSESPSTKWALKPQLSPSHLVNLTLVLRRRTCAAAHLKYIFGAKVETSRLPPARCSTAPKECGRSARVGGCAKLGRAR
mmetsp:Transcript_120291/g.312207  ORF Transcript_120291/g.312207 Transcript_120291/m.312207 type:complete len:216 (-) Transcript_120291:6-653(-)